MKEQFLAEEIRGFYSSIPKGKTYLEEAEFGLRSIYSSLKSLPAGSRVLEVGSGPCILLSELADRFPNFDFQGIEPMSDGFALFDEFIESMRKTRPAIQLHLGGYESFHSNDKWDLIFLVNVFEHLPDWRDFLQFVEKQLKPGGHCVILCPNYGFPYESHFRLPIIFNKQITGALFKRHIQKFEKEQNYAGLYDSLNFVSLRQVRKAVRNVDLNLNIETGIIYEMIKRLDTDPSFRERQKILAIPAKFLLRTKLLGILLRVSFIQNVLPYMQLTLSKKGPSE